MCEQRSKAWLLIAFTSSRTVFPRESTNIVSGHALRMSQWDFDCDCDRDRDRDRDRVCELSKIPNYNVAAQAHSYSS